MREWKEVNICRSSSGPMFFNTAKVNELEAEGWHLRTTFVDPRFPSFGQNISGLFYRDVADAPKVARPSVDDVAVDPSVAFPKAKAKVGA